MTDVINTNGALQPTPDFEACTNFKEFFVRDDALANITTELSFSIFQRYMCKAGCSMCYVQDEWVDDETFTGYVPTEIPQEIEDKIISFFSYFEIISTMDDLYYIKKNYKHLFDFYVRNSHMMSSSSMTDIAFIQQYDIIMNDMNFKSVYEISFSDTFLNKKGGTFVDNIIDKLTSMVAKLSLRQIKIILCNGDESDQAVSKLIEWAQQNKIVVDIHDDIMQETNDRFELEQADRQETNHFSGDNYLYLIKCEVVYLQYTSMFLTISEAISSESKPFYDIDEQDDISKFIVDMLKYKIQMYEEESKRMGTTCRSKYYDYFVFVATSVIVNDDYNFIPRFILKPYSKMYQRLAEDGFADTKYGLIRNGTTKPLPLFDITGKPKQKLHHFPIITVIPPKEEELVPYEHPITFMPVLEDRLKTRTMQHPLIEQTTLDTLQFLIKDGQNANFKMMMTNKCNLSCTYCFQQHDKELILWNEETLDHMLHAIIKLDSSNCWDTTKLWDWFGGEPLIYKQLILDFMKRNREAIENVDNMEFSITTNATLLTEDFIEEYLGYKNTYMIVSFDSVFLEHDLRNHTTSTTKAILQSLNQIANKVGPYNTSVTMTINPRLLPTFEQTMELLYRSGVRNFLANPLIYNKDTMEQWTAETLNELKTMLIAFANKHKDVFFEFGAEVAPKKTTNCLTGGKNFAIDGSGDISGCFFFSNDKEKHGDIMMANVFSGLISDRYDEMSQMDTTFYATEEKCQTCDLQDLCYICPAGIKDVTETKYFESNKTCQDVIRFHIEVADLIKNQNVPFRHNIVEKYNELK